MNEYRNRLIHRQIEEALSAMGAVLVQGPKAVGKSTTSRRFAKSSISLDESVALIEFD